MRRTLIIVAIVIVLLGAGVVAYFYFFNKPATVTVAPSGSASLPVAGQGAPTVTETAPAADTASNAPVTISARLVKISAGPVVPGEVIVDTKATASSSASAAVNYIERQSGNVFSYNTSSKMLTRTSNKTVPGIQSAAWLPNASLAFVRYLSGADFSTINTYALPSDGSLSEAPGEHSAKQNALAGGFFLAQNLSDLAVSSTSILSLASGVNGSIASLSRTDGTKAKEVFTTPLSALRIGFAGKSQYLAFTKPSGTLGGSVFIVDGTGRFSRIAGPLNGLVAKASPSGKWVLVSYVSGDSMQMELADATTGEALPLPVATIADKCVWTADSASIYCGVPVDPPAGFNYPDDWYQGAVSFSDRIWVLQVSGRYAQFVLDFSKENSGAPLDATALAVDQLTTTLVFVNKLDGSLWSYQL